MTDAPPLTDQQTAVLQAIYDYFREHGTWPAFIAIDRPLRRAHDWDTAAIVQSLPEDAIVHPRHGNLRPVSNDEIRLRLRGFALVQGSSDDTERFVRLLRWLAEREKQYEPPDGNDDEMPQVTSQEVAQHLSLDDADRLPLQRLYTMLQLDHWGLGGSGSNEDGWQVRLGPEIWRFRNVQTIDDCVAAREAWLAEGRPTIPRVNPAPEAWLSAQAPSSPAPYVDQKVIEAIRAKDGQSKFDVTKLLTLIDELNDNYDRGNTYASHALLRGLLDHVPPILNCKNFEEVANNYRWSQTDKKYIKWLANFRAQGDDALHRQISTRADLLGFDDMPASVCVDWLLRECADHL